MKPFHFTLRESILGMLAVGAMLALAIQSCRNSEPYRPTSFFETFDAGYAKQLAASQSQGLADGSRFMGVGESESRGGRSVDRDIHLSIEESPEAIAQLMQKFEEQIQTLLRDAGCAGVSSGGAVSADSSGKRYSRQLSIDYEKNNLRGHILLFRIPTLNDNWQITIVIHEYQTYRR